MIVDSEQKTLLANPALRRLVGAQGERALRGEPLGSLVAPDQRKICRDLLDAVVTGSPLSPFETRFARLDGAEFPVEMSAGGMTHEGEATLYLIVRDITERKRSSISRSTASTTASSRWTTG